MACLQHRGQKWRTTMLVTAVLGMSLLGGPAAMEAPEPVPGCGAIEQCWATPLPDDKGNEDENLGVGGFDPSPGGGSGDDGAGTEPGGGDSSQPPPYAGPPCEGLDDLSPIFSCIPPAPPGEPVEIVTYPPVYASDLISFVPHVPTFASEPAGAGLIGKATNFVASAEEHYLTGTLLGYGVAVAFVPTDFTFDYGDGTALDSVSGGTLWSDTGSPQFTATDTSHAYGARGTYTATVSVHYDAYVNFGTDTWYPVIGQVHSTSPGFPIRIYEPSTGLVNATCDENPQGPGC